MNVIKLALILIVATFPYLAGAEEADLFTPIEKACCKVCSAGKACGDTCISRAYTCHVGPGCACNAGSSGGGSSNGNGNSKPGNGSSNGSSFLTRLEGTYQGAIKLKSIITNDPLYTSIVQGSKESYKYKIKRKGSDSLSLSASKPFKLNLNVSKIKNSSFKASGSFQTNSLELRGIACEGELVFQVTNIDSDEADIKITKIITCPNGYRTEQVFKGEVGRD